MKSAAWIGALCVLFIFPASSLAAPPIKYSVQVEVTGNGVVASSPGGISCPTTCQASYKQAVTISLAALPAAGETFLGWGGACSGTGSCIIPSIQGDVQVAAEFSDNGGGGGGPTIEELQVRIESLEASIAGLEALLFGISRGVDANTGVDTLRFSEMNVQVVSGSGSTRGTENGAGNLIIGYNERDTADLATTLPDDRTGSHNLIIGPYHSYSIHGGIVGGQDNRLSGNHTAVLSGERNIAQGPFSFVLGGEYNQATGSWSGVSGGSRNISSGSRSSVTGGAFNEASNQNDTVSGGGQNIASGGASVVAAGYYNRAAGLFSVVSGGSNNLADGERSSVAGGFSNIARGNSESIAGGEEVFCLDDSGEVQAVMCAEGILSPVD